MTKVPKFLRRKFKRPWKSKAAGPDDISSEMLTALGEFSIIEITKLLNINHDIGVIPSDLKKSVYIAISKINRYSWMWSALHNKCYEPPCKSHATSVDE